MIAQTSRIALMTLMRREVTRVLRIWPQTLLPTPISMFLYFCIFGYVIGDRIRDMDGVPYIAFLVPGLVMMGIINNAFSNVASSFFGVKFARNIEEMLVSPMPMWTILLGFITGGLFRAFVVAITVLGLVAVFTDIHFLHPWVVLYMSVITALLMSIGGFLNGLYARKFDDVAIIPTFILTPLTYLGGVFYSVDLLPPFWRMLSHLNPIFYMVNGFREGMIGQSDIALSVSLSVVSLFTLILGSLTYFLLCKGVGLKQ